MKIRILEEDKDKLILEISGARHTLPNLLREQLWKCEDTEFVGYSKDHPDLGDPVLVVRGKNPRKILKKAVEDLRKDIKSLRNEIEKI